MVKDWGNPYWGDNVPCDVPAPEDVIVEHYCPECFATWRVIMDYELGSYFYYDEDNDPYCPLCGCLGTTS